MLRAVPAMDSPRGGALSRKISETTVRRLSLYLRILEEVESAGTDTISSEELAERAGTTAAQVRKDLSLFGSFGKRGLGYAVGQLAGGLREILGLGRTWRVALVGAGRIGSALFEYPGFRRRGFEIVAVLDADPGKLDTEWDGIPVRSTTELEHVLSTERIDIVILAVPAEAVPDILNRVVDAGVKGILNFAPMQLRVPPDVAVQDVNMVMELEALSFALHQSHGSHDRMPDRMRSSGA
jgi:redox-sensing transcriptional repressor